MLSSFLHKFPRQNHYLKRLFTNNHTSIQSIKHHVELKNLITAEEHVKRREEFVNKLLDQSGSRSHSHIVVFPSALVHYMAIDVPFVFRQHSNFRYLTGFPETNSVLMLEIDAQSTRPNWSLYVEERSPHETLWSGSSLGRSEVAAVTGIEDARLVKDFAHDLGLALSGQSKILWYDDKGVNKNFKSTIIQHGVNGIENPAPLVEQLRLLKSSAEIEMMSKAAQVACSSLVDVMKWGEPGVGEAQLWGHVEYASKLRGAPLAYPPVVAGGNRSNTIHYLRNDGIIKDGDMVLMDVGSDVHGYVSDITRTWPINGQFSPYQKVLYEIVLEVLQMCISQCSPESSLSKLYHIMTSELASRLIKERVVVDKDQFQGLGHRACPHHIGHYLGLDVHDTPSISTNHPLLPGVAFPLEPAVYFPVSARPIARSEFQGLGVRIEDDFVMASDGKPRLLTDGCPRSLAEVESILGSPNRLCIH